MLAQVASSFIDFGSADTPAVIDDEEMRPVESKRESFDSIYQRLMPEAQVAVERHTGASLSPRLVIVDQNDLEGVFGSSDGGALRCDSPRQRYHGPSP